MWFFLYFCIIVDGCFLDGCCWPKSFQNSLRRNWMLRQPLLYLLVSKHPVFLFTLTQSVRLPMVTYPHCAAPVWLTGHYATLLVTRCFPHQILTSSFILPWAITRFLDPFYTFIPAHLEWFANLPQPLARGAEDFPWGDRHF